MFNFLKKKKQETIELKKDPFPDYNDVKTRVIIDVRDPEDVEFYGKLPNSVNIQKMRVDMFFIIRVNGLYKNFMKLLQIIIKFLNQILWNI
jgi:hypothetical protein